VCDQGLQHASQNVSTYFVEGADAVCDQGLQHTSQNVSTYFVEGADAVCDQGLQHTSQNVSTFLWKVLTQCVIRGCSTRRKK